MDPVTRCEGRFNPRWHASEKRIENLATSYFRDRGYRIASHCLQDRFDLVAAKVENGPRIDALVGIEIKSKNDTLKRLDGQIPEYIHLFDFVYVALEKQQLPSIPLFVGIIYVLEDKVTVEREAHRIGKTLFPWCVTDAALVRTIKMSNGIRKRHKELKAYLFVLDDLRRKILYNCIFWNDPLPLNEQEKNVVNFIEEKSASISELGLFMHECGKARIAGEYYGK